MSVKFSRRDANKLLIGLPAFALGSKFSNALMPTEESKISAVDPYPRKRIAVLDTEISYVDTGQRRSHRLSPWQSDLLLSLAQHHPLRQQTREMPGA